MLHCFKRLSREKDCLFILSWLLYTGVLWREMTVFSWGITESAWLGREVSSVKGGVASGRGGERQQRTSLQHGFLEIVEITRSRDLARLPGLWKERALFWSPEAPQKCIATYGMVASLLVWEQAWKKGPVPRGHSGDICLFSFCLILGFPIKKNKHSCSFGFCSPDKT